MSFVPISQDSGWVSGGEPISGLDLFVQIGDGGPLLSRFGLAPGRAAPIISQVDLSTGTIFQHVSDAAQNLSSPDLPQTAVVSLALVGTPTTVAAQGKLARIEIDTTGFFGGEWPILLNGVLPYAAFGGPYATNFAGVPGTIQNGSLTIPITRGDYNQNGVFDAADADLLAAAIRGPSPDRAANDLNGDQRVDLDDHRFWVQQYAHVFFGDANFDGQFNSVDLVQVFIAGTYEDSVPENSLWATGDWDGDGDFTTADLVTAFQGGAYEAGSAPAVSVPEPVGAALWFLGWGCLFMGQRSWR